MINGVKVSLVYHLYCKNIEDIQVGTGNVYNEINRRCLEHFHDVFDDAVFCVCVDDTTNLELIQKAVEWIWSCGFKDNVTIKVKQNPPYWDAQTFYDEVVDHLDEFEGMVFFGHSKGGSRPDCNSVRQWVVFSYYACLDNMAEHVKELTGNSVAYTYVPIVSKAAKSFNCNGWLAPGTFFLFNPRKILTYTKINGIQIPKLDDRYSAERFIPSIINIMDEERCSFLTDIMFDSVRNCMFVTEESDFSEYSINHIELISYFLSSERISEYLSFYDQITEGLPQVNEE